MSYFIIRLMRVKSLFLLEEKFVCRNIVNGNLAVSNIRNLECSSFDFHSISYGYGKFKEKIHITEYYPWSSFSWYQHYENRTTSWSFPRYSETSRVFEFRGSHFRMSELKEPPVQASPLRAGSCLAAASFPLHFQQSCPRPFKRALSGLSPGLWEDCAQLCAVHPQKAPYSSRKMIFRFRLSRRNPDFRALVF